MNDGRRIFEEATGASTEELAEKEAVMTAVVAALSDALDGVRDFLEERGAVMRVSSVAVEVGHRDWGGRCEVRHLIGYGEPVKADTVEGLTCLLRNTVVGFERCINDVVGELMKDEGEEE